MKRPITFPYNCDSCDADVTATDTGHTNGILAYGKWAARYCDDCWPQYEPADDGEDDDDWSDSRPWDDPYKFYGVSRHDFY